jgi:hypothetical protein
MKTIRTLKGAADLPPNWAWVNVAPLGAKPRWTAAPWPREKETWEHAMSRVKLHHKAWGGSPEPWVGGDASALADLVESGYVTLDSSGWHKPTAKMLALPI